MPFPRHSARHLCLPLPVPNPRVALGQQGVFYFSNPRSKPCNRRQYCICPACIATCVVKICPNHAAFVGKCSRKKSLSDSSASCSGGKTRRVSRSEAYTASFACQSSCLVRRTVTALGDEPCKYALCQLFGKSCSLPSKVNALSASAARCPSIHDGGFVEPRRIYTCSSDKSSTRLLVKASIHVFKRHSAFIVH